MNQEEIRLLAFEIIKANTLNAGLRKEAVRIGKNDQASNGYKSPLRLVY